MNETTKLKKNKQTTEHERIWEIYSHRFHKKTKKTHEKKRKLLL